MKGILMDEYGDLAVDIRRNRVGEISNGWVLGDCTEQLIERILIANRGEFKEAPLIGGEVNLLLNGQVDPFYKGRLKAMLEAMLIPVRKLVFDEKGINIEFDEDENI